MDSPLQRLQKFAQELEPVDRTFPLNQAEKDEIAAQPPGERAARETMIRFHVAQGEANLPAQSRKEEETETGLHEELRKLAGESES